MLFEKKVKSVLQAFAARVFPPGDLIKKSPVELGSCAQARDFIASLPPYYRYPLILIILGFEYMAPALTLKPFAFSRLPDPEKDRYISRWARSSMISLRGAFMVMKALISLGYYNSQEARDALGYTVACGSEKTKK